MKRLQYKKGIALKSSKKLSLCRLLLAGTSFLAFQASYSTEDLVWRSETAQKIFKYLPEKDLKQAARVNRTWYKEVQKRRISRLEEGKKQLLASILEATQAEPNEIERAKHHLNIFLASNKFESLSPDIQEAVQNIKSRILQPEELIRSDQELRNSLLTTSRLQADHKALAPLNQLIKDLKNLSEKRIDEVKDISIPLLRFYQRYVNELQNASSEERSAYLGRKVILSGEGFTKDASTITSYRISQDMARALLSKDQYGLLRKRNSSGSHAVHQQGQVHFKGNTTNNGLSVGFESAAYWFAQCLFGRNMTPTALLTLHEVNMHTPPERSEARAAFAQALATGLDSDAFFAQYPHHQNSFTEQSSFHVVQASQHISGVSLETYLKDNRAASSIDAVSFSEQVILSLLLNPADGTPGNFMLERHHDHKALIVGIDNDMAFGPAVVKLPNGRHSLEVKNILYCLPQMEDNIAVSVRKLLLNLSPELMLFKWLSLLKKQQQAYEALKQSGYNKGNTHVPYLTPQAYEDELKLPFKLIPETISSFLQTFKKMQQRLKDRPGLTHNQLFSYLQPVAHRLYQKYVSEHPGDPLSAFQKVHSSHRDSSLEELLKDQLIERLPGNQTLSEALEAEKTPADITVMQTQSIEEAAVELLQQLDLSQQVRVTPFLERTVSSFPSLLQEKLKVHASWLQDSLLYRTLREFNHSVPLNVLLDQLKLDPEWRHSETQQTMFHAAIQGKQPIETLEELYKALSGEKASILLNSRDNQRRTPLDYAFEQKNLQGFMDLVQMGAFTCSPTSALQFYKSLSCSQFPPDLKAAFQKLMKQNPEVEWRISLETLLPSEKQSNKDNTYTSVVSSSYNERWMPPNVKRQLINDQNQFISKANIAANHQVGYAQANSSIQSHGLYFKVYPSLPGLEEACGRFIRKLLPSGAPHTDLIKIDNIPILVSQAIPGDTLFKVLEEAPARLAKLDAQATSALIIAALLTNPEDGKPENYIVSPHPLKPEAYQLVSVDNDQCFVPAIVKEKPDIKKGKPQPVAQVKTILYCLEQMKQAVHPDVRHQLINIHPDVFLEEWLKELKHIAGGHSKFMQPSEYARLFKDHKCFIGIPFQSGSIRHLYEKFVLLRDLLSETPTITHLELLIKLEPRLAKRYQAALQQNLSVKERFKMVDQPFYQTRKDGSHTTMTQSGHILQSMNIPLKETLLESVQKGKELSISQALRELNDIKQEKQQQTLQSLGARVGDLKLLQSLKLEESRVAFLESIAKQQKKLSPQEQRAILEYLKMRRSIRKLILPRFNELNDEYFKVPTFYAVTDFTYFAGLEHLRILDIRECQRITSEGLVALSKGAPVLEELNLGRNYTLKKISEKGYFIDKPLKFPQLIRLNIAGCFNITELNIEAPQLKWLNIKGCRNLTDEGLDLLIDNGCSLETLVIKNCPKITFEELRHFVPYLPVNFLLELNLYGSSTVKEIAESSKVLKLTGTDLRLKLHYLNRVIERKPYLKSLHFMQCNLQNENINHINKNPNLVSLDLRNGISCGAAKLLEKINKGSTLKLLLNKIDDDGVKLLVENNTLTSLNLEGNKVTDSGAIFLANNTLIQDLNLNSNNVTDKGAQALASNFTLKTLDLGNTVLDNVFIRYISIQTNDLNFKFTDKEIKFYSFSKAILNSLVFGPIFSKIFDKELMHYLSLKKYVLSINTITEKGASFLAYNKNLKNLSLKNNQIGSNGATELAQNNNLTFLNLERNNIDDIGAQALAKNTVIKSLYLGNPKYNKEISHDNQEIDLVCESDNKIGDQSAEAFSKNYTLTCLDLTANCITDEGAQALLHNFTLQHLNLSFNKIKNIIMKPSIQNTALLSLDLEGNRLSDKDALSLIQIPNLTSLNLGSSQIHDTGVARLSEISALKSLNLANNHIGDMGATLIAKIPTLESLNLNWNIITDIGAASLAQSKNLISLELRHNPIQEKGATALFLMPTLKSLDLRDNKLEYLMKEQEKFYFDKSKSIKL